MLLPASNNKHDNFKHGSIVRIELENFMIYRHIEFYPGPFLNIILGPNGSGKSALVCSIIMGFGGDPQITGRSSNLIDYVRFGAQVARITIEIYSGDACKNNYLVQREIRVITKENKNECHNYWKLNGQNVNKTKIQEFTKQLNIDINNLCQILPQEKVTEFSRMTPKELLFSTEKSIGDVNMYNHHMKLISLSHEASNLEQKIKECKAFMLKCQNFKTNIEPDLKLINQKKKFEEEIEWLQKKQVWLEYEEKRLLYTDIKEEFKQKKAQYIKFEEKIKPLKTNIEKVEKLLSKIKNEKLKSNHKMKVYYSQLSDIYNSIDSYQDHINQLVSSYNEKLSEQKTSIDRLAQYEQDWNNYKNDLINYPDKNQFEEDANKLKNDLDSIELEIKTVMLKINSNKNQLEKYRDEKRYHESRKRSVNDLFDARMKKINEKDSNTKTVYDWLQNNKDKFKGRIYPPLITQINVIRNEWANYVESAIGSVDMSTFLFEFIDDLELFSNEVKKQLDIRVNVAMIPNASENINDEPIDIKMYKSYGIFARVSDLFTAPEQVISYLIKNYNVHQIPVGNDTTEEKINELIYCSQFKKIITNRNIYSIVISPYDNEKTTRITAMNPPKYLSLIIDEEQIKSIDENLASLEESINKVGTVLKEQNEIMENLKNNHSTKSKNYQAIESKRNAIVIIEKKIEEKERQIKIIKESMENIDKHKENLKQQLETVYSKQWDLLQQTSNILSECIIENKTEICTQFRIKIIKYFQMSYEREYSQIRIEEENFKEELKELVKKCNDIKEEAKQYRQRAIEKSGFDFNNEIDPKIQQKIDELPSDLEEVNNVIMTLMMRCKGIKNVDETLFEEYRKYQKEIEDKSKQCSDLENELNLKRGEIDDLKPTWMEALKNLISKINENFSNFMDYLKYSGEVYLFMGDKEYSFDDYGIKIKVKFRDSEPLKDLDAYHQSGGERSVSTMIYMLSLQELAHVPFRVVDEINQGMDETNERCVFDLIAQVSRKNSSQYFLLSPKLLPKLNYTAEMTIHVIFNGPHIYVNWTKVLNNLLDKK